MASVYLRHGSPTMVDYTPATAKTAGTVVPTGDYIAGIVHTDIAANAKGAYAICGGIYSATGDGVIAVGAAVYWNASAGKVTKTVGSNEYLGTCVQACAADDGEVWFAHAVGHPAIAS